MKTTKPDRRFKKCYILRSTILLVPPLVAWIVLDAAMVRSYSCPSCGQKIEHPTIKNRKAEDPIRCYCSKCDTEWDTGLRESSE